MLPDVVELLHHMVSFSPMHMGTGRIKQGTPQGSVFGKQMGGEVGYDYTNCTLMFKVHMQCTLCALDSAKELSSKKNKIKAFFGVE